ncbi:membrane-spanning 4-domains subfamily A member 4A-like isoform X1 [Misgurnus anguillicaudatus]|uniref:membrane-spanning 4-domains subfamily A member 4A-like isoform X1 n=1 Tax=Misgurnus anguillicaudatus TaxID=75329 RepID=UPI003CCFB9BE
MLSEIETAGSSDASAAAAEGNPGPSDLLEITFQKNPNQYNKFLEAEPKILGVTQIMLTVLFITSKMVYFSDWIETNIDIGCSCVGIIAGSLAIAAQNLHLPTLKACLGMQIVTCLTYGFILNISFGFRSNPATTACWYSQVFDELSVCRSLVIGFSQMELIDNLTEAVQIALSITLAVYCCKVIQCCSPRSHEPVIVIKPRASD